jgi:hypothetical protein
MSGQVYIKVITKLPNSEQSYKGKVKTHNYINRQNQSTTENCENRNDPDLVQVYVLGVSMLPMILQFFYWILELFRQCGIIAFHFITHMYMVTVIYQMIFASLSSNTTGVTSEAATAYPS